MTNEDLVKFKKFPLSFRIKFLRSERNLYLKDVAKELNVSITTVCNWEKGVKKPNYPNIIALCKFFDVPLRLLYDNVPDEDL